jgi:hypothetical protein
VLLLVPAVLVLSGCLDFGRELEPDDVVRNGTTRTIDLVHLDRVGYGDGPQRRSLGTVEPGEEVGVDTSLHVCSSDDRAVVAVDGSGRVVDVWDAGDCQDDVDHQEWVVIDRRDPMRPWIGGGHP